MSVVGDDVAEGEQTVTGLQNGELEERPVVGDSDKGTLYKIPT